MFLSVHEELVYLSTEANEWQGKKTFKVNCEDKDGKILKFKINDNCLNQLQKYKPFVPTLELKQYNGSNDLRIVGVTTYD